LYGRTPYTGNVFLEGKPTWIRCPKDAKDEGIGLLTEDRKRDGLLFNFAIRENVTLHDLPRVTRLGVMRPPSEKAIAEDFLTRLSIRARSIDTAVSTLSGGNQQKVVLAKVLLPKPRVLLLDEPTKGVDVGAKNEIYKLMMDLVKDGMSLVVISSELPELLAICDRYIVLVRGRVADQFSRSEGGEQRLILAATGSGPSGKGP
jgi:ABC-type sugar transport system ATPase subunit